MKQREIKFRAFNTEDKEIYSNDVALLVLYKISIGEPLLEKWKIDQFTGLTDKNGKEIYEGDIIQNVADNGTRLSKFEISWQQSCCGFVKEREDGHTFTLEISRFFEVIGNIHTSPELLNP